MFDKFENIECSSVSESEVKMKSDESRKFAEGVGESDEESMCEGEGESMCEGEEGEMSEGDFEEVLEMLL